MENIRCDMLTICKHSPNADEAFYKLHKSRMNILNVNVIATATEQREVQGFIIVYGIAIKMRNFQILLLTFSLCYMAYYMRWPVVQADCDVCQANGAACVNLTSFYLCFGGTAPVTKQLFTCSDGLVCTNLPNICFQSSTRPASCGDTSSCGVCNSNYVFACTSRTTFSFCFGATQPSNINGTCPTGKICDASTQNICVDDVQPSSIVCSRETPA